MFSYIFLHTNKYVYKRYKEYKNTVSRIQCEMCLYSCMSVISKMLILWSTDGYRQMAVQFRLLHWEFVRVFFSNYRFIQILFRVVISSLVNLKITLIMKYSFNESSGDSDMCCWHGHEVIWHIVQFGVTYLFLFILKCIYSLWRMSSLQEWLCYSDIKLYSWVLFILLS